MLCIPRAREWLYPESVQINLLSANTHNSSGWRSGSGLYSSEGALAYYHDTAEAAGGRLLIADLDIKPAKVIRSLMKQSSVILFIIATEEHRLVRVRHRHRPKCARLRRHVPGGRLYDVYLHRAN